MNYLTSFKNMQLFSQKYAIIFKTYAIIFKTYAHIF